MSMMDRKIKEIGLEKFAQYSAQVENYISTRNVLPLPQYKSPCLTEDENGVITLWDNGSLAVVFDCGAREMTIKALVIWLANNEAHPFE